MKFKEGDLVIVPAGTNMYYLNARGEMMVKRHRHDVIGVLVEQDYLQPRVFVDGKVRMVMVGHSMLRGVT